MGEARQTIGELRNQLEALNAQTLQVALQFEREAAARAEAEAVADVLGTETSRLQAEADELRARLASEQSADSAASAPTPDARSETRSAE